MNFTKNAIWFWTTIFLSIALVTLLLWPESEKEPKIENIINLAGDNDSLYTHYAPYIGYVKAVKLKMEGKKKESQTILATLTRSKDQDISKIAEHELRQGPLLIDKGSVIKNAKSNEEKPAVLLKASEEPDVTGQPQQESLLSDVKDPAEGNLASPTVKAVSSSGLSLTSAKGQRLDYKGAMNDRQANGYGVGTYETGSVYRGDWKNNLRDGKGEFRWKDGDIYVGHFSKDYRQGQGTYTWKNGDHYVGGWYQDRRHGQGTLYDKDGKVKKKGVWQNDVLVKESK